MCSTHNHEFDGSVMTKRKNDFDEFMKEVAKDSSDAGETAAFEAYGEHFGLAIQVIRLRKEPNWTQQQLAKVSGVQQSEISRIERGQANPTFRTLQQIAQALKKTISFVDLTPTRPRGTRRRATA
jgi:XRE family transcriptional regulator, regulator of sulfur utilization